MSAPEKRGIQDHLTFVEIVHNMIEISMCSHFQLNKQKVRKQKVLYDTFLRSRSVWLFLPPSVSGDEEIHEIHVGSYARPCPRSSTIGSIATES